MMMVHALRVSFVFTSVAVLTACASAPVQPTYVSSAIYKDYTCAQLEQEYRRVNTHIGQTSKRKGFDMTGIGVGISAGRGGVYPRVSVGMGKSTDSSNPRLSRLLGERDAIAESSRFKGCDFRMPHLEKPVQTPAQQKETNAS